MQKLWLVLLLLLTPIAYAAKCSEEDVSITTVEGIGTVYSSSDSSNELEARFIDACFERSGWTLRAPVLIVREDPAGAVVTAENAKIESEGANGTVRRLTARGETTNLEGLTLRLEKSYKIDGFASSRYDVVAERGQLVGKRLTLQKAVFNKLSDAGVVTERYQAASVILEDNRATLNQLLFGSPQFGLSANLGSSNASGVQLSGVNGLVGRNSAGSEIGFSADSALRLENGVYRLENTTLNLFGIPIFVGRMDYDPRCPFEVPFVFGLGRGLTFGLENLLLTCDGKTRGTFAVYDLFGKASNAPFNSVMALGLSVSYIDGTSSYFVGQPKAASFRATVQHEPLTGLTSAFALDTGARIESPLVSLRSAEGRIGIAYNFNLPEIQPFTIRPKLELGTVGESLGLVTRDFHGFVRGNLGINLAYSLAGFTFSGNWTGRLSYYFGDTWNGFNADYTSSLGIGYSLANVGSAGLTFANTEQPFIPPFATHTLSPATTIGANLRLAPSIQPIPLGYAGLTFENPTLSFTLLYNLRRWTWVNQRADLGFTVSFYDGSTPTDHLGNVFQTPLIGFSPRANFDLITNKGSAGANLTYFGLSLAYTLGFDIEIPTGAFKFNFGLRLR
jgi:hypothetical protein